MLYDEYLQILNSELEKELIELYPLLFDMNAKHNNSIDIKYTNYMENHVRNHGLNSDIESQYDDILLYPLYLFVAWLNSNL